MKLPEPFIVRTKSILKEEWSDFALALSQVSPVSIRVNNKKELIHSDAIPWCSDGYYLSERPSFTLDPLFHAGTYYVQEASSMFLSQALLQNVPKDSVVLDLCASPGGKSTLISEYLADNGFLLSNEIIRSRAYVLSENIQKWGNCNTVVSNNKPSEIGSLTHMFDAMLVDAPCSGEGMFRKDPNSINEWSEANVQLCATRQKEILSDVWTALKPNGILIYSTCTYNLEENEENVAWIMQELGAEYVPLQVEQSWRISESSLGYHFYPHRTKGEGFFLAVLRKNDEILSEVKLKKKELLPFVSCPKDADGLIKEQDDFSFYASNEQLNMFPKRYALQVNLFIQRLNCLLIGTEVFRYKGKNKIPQQGLALSKYLNQNKISNFDTNLEQALAYLRTEALVLPDCDLGIVLLTYQNIPLGWVKNVGNRCNNLYPNEWRIRKR